MSNQAYKFKKTLFFFLFASVFLFTLLFTDKVCKAIGDSLLLCAKRVIPSLFPFLVFNELICRSGLAEDFGKLFGKPISKLFRISNVSSVAFFLGNAGGFPLGAKSAQTLYSEKLITREEFSNLVCFCNNTGPGFIFGVCEFFVGGRKNALIVFLSQLISSILIGFFLSKKSENSPPAQKAKKESEISLSVIPLSITSAVIPIINICSFVVFFSVIISGLDCVFSAVRLPGTLKIICYGFIELTNGISKLTPAFVGKINDGYFIPTLLCSLFIGWGGLSVHFQTLSILKDENSIFGKYLISKGVNSLLCVVFSALFYIFLH